MNYNYIAIKRKKTSDEDQLEQSCETVSFLPESHSASWIMM